MDDREKVLQSRRNKFKQTSESSSQRPERTPVCRLFIHFIRFFIHLTIDIYYSYLRCAYRLYVSVSGFYGLSNLVTLYFFTIFSDFKQSLTITRMPDISQSYCPRCKVNKFFM